MRPNVCNCAFPAFYAETITGHAIGCPIEAEAIAVAEKRAAWERKADLARLAGEHVVPIRRAMTVRDLKS